MMKTQQKDFTKGNWDDPVMCSCTEIYTSYRMCYYILAFCPTHYQIAPVKTEVPSKWHDIPLSKITFPHNTLRIFTLVIRSHKTYALWTQMNISFNRILLGKPVQNKSVHRVILNKLEIIQDKKSWSVVHFTAAAQSQLSTPSQGKAMPPQDASACT